MEIALSGVQTSMLFYATSMVFSTDGSLIGGCVGFAIHPTEESGFGYKISSPTDIFNLRKDA
jgi:hypothetical protein